MTLQTDTDALQEFLQHEGAKHPIALREALQFGYRHIHEAIESLSEEQASWRGGAAHSALDLIAALTIERRRCVVICHHLSVGRTPPERELAHADSMRAETLIQAAILIEDAQAKLIKFIDELWPMTDITTRWGETPAGPLNCKEWVAWQRIRDLEVARLIEHMRREPGFPLDAVDEDVVAA